MFGDGVAITTFALTNPPNTLNVVLNGNVATSYHEDAGVAVPAAGILNIHGDGVAIATSGAGNTVTISLDGDVATKYHTQDGNNAVPAAGILNVDGDSGVLTTTSGGNTVTVNLTPATDGQVIIGSSIGNPAWANITSTGGTILITNGHNSINLETKYNPSTIPAFEATNTTAHTNVTGDGTAYNVICDVAEFDNTGSYNVTTGLFTAPVNGIYHFTANIAINNLSNAFNMGAVFLYINGSAAAAPTANLINAGVVFVPDAFNEMTLLVVRDIQLTAGETVGPVVQVSGGTKTVGETIVGIRQSTFSGFLIN